jgi:hypothetical protein
MKINTHTNSFRAIMAVLSVVIMFGIMAFVQSCGGSSSDTVIPEGEDYDDVGYDDDDNTNYRDKAYDLVDQLYEADSTAEVEPILKEILTIIGVPVYDHNNAAIIAGSGSLTQGMALRDYQVYVLADTFFQYMQNPNRHTTARAFAAGVQNLGGDNGPVKIKFAVVDQTQEFDDGMVVYMASLYNTYSTVMGTKRPYFIADMFTALAEKTPKHEVTGNFYLDPLQAFLMKLDWFSKPLNPAEYVGASNFGGVMPVIPRVFLSADALPRDMDNAKGDGMDTVKGYWSMAQFVVGEAVDTLGTVLDVGGMVAGEIIADGTQISIECDSPMYYGPGVYTIIISVAFGVDLSEYATKYGWTVGVDVPNVGPIKRAKVALVGWDDLAPKHGLFNGGDLNLLTGLGAGGAIADDDGEVSINFKVNEQPETTCTEEAQDTVSLAAEVNPITDPTAWQSGIVNSIWPRSMPFWIEVRWKKSTSACSGGGGGGGYSD